MPMAISLTIDTNLPQELWLNQAKRDRVEALLELQKAGLVELAVTGYIHDDITHGELAERVNELPELPIAEVPRLFTLDVSTLDGPDVLADGRIVALIESDDFLDVRERLLRSGRLPKDKEPDRRDWLHLEAHLTSGREIFLTWDRGLLAYAPTLDDRLGMRVMTPEEFLDGFEASRTS
jgi:hypothetical protein